MIRPGLVSISFRQLAPHAVIEQCARAGLDGIEWGGDVHVPHGHLACAREVARQCADAGLAVAAYGSYYRAGSSELAGLPFSTVLETAVALGAPLIRIWAGTSSTAHTDDAQRRHVIDDCRRICQMTGGTGMRIAFEFHNDTLADSAKATHALLRAVDHPACATYWQPPHGLPTDDAAAGLRLLLPWLSNLHVFHWWPDAGRRLPLADGAERWRQFFAVLADDPRDHWASLEFLPNDDPGLLPQEAQTLRQLLAEVAATQMQARPSVH